MGESSTTLWAIPFLAIYMSLLSAYMASTHPDAGKRKRLLRVFSVGVVIASGAILWEALA